MLLPIILPKKEATTILLQSLQDELLKTIETVLQKNNDHTLQSHDAASVITNINNDKYEIKIENTAYWVKNGVGLALHIGDPVWIHIPNGDMNEMFIMAKK